MFSEAFLCHVVTFIVCGAREKMIVSVDTQRLIAVKNEMLLVNNELKKQMQRMEMIVLSVDGEWKGDAEKAYESKLFYMKKQFMKLTEYFDEYAATLGNMADDYENYDTELSSKIDMA